MLKGLRKKESNPISRRVKPIGAPGVGAALSPAGSRAGLHPAPRVGGEQARLYPRRPADEVSGPRIKRGLFGLKLGGLSLGGDGQSGWEGPPSHMGSSVGDSPACNRAGSTKITPCRFSAASGHRSQQPPAAKNISGRRNRKRGQGPRSREEEEDKGQSSGEEELGCGRGPIRHRPRHVFGGSGEALSTVPTVGRDLGSPCPSPWHRAPHGV